MCCPRNLLVLVVLFCGCGQPQQPKVIPGNLPLDDSTAQTSAPVTADDRVLTPEEAMEWGGRTRTVEFRVAKGSVVFIHFYHEDGVTRKHQWVYLSDVAAEDLSRVNGGIVVGIPEGTLKKHKASTANELIDIYQAKRIRVTGKIAIVTGFDRFDKDTSKYKHVFIEVDSPDKIQGVVDKN